MKNAVLAEVNAGPDIHLKSCVEQIQQKLGEKIEQWTNKQEAKVEEKAEAIK